MKSILLYVLSVVNFSVALGVVMSNANDITTVAIFLALGILFWLQAVNVELKEQ